MREGAWPQIIEVYVDIRIYVRRKEKGFGETVSDAYRYDQEKRAYDSIKLELQSWVRRVRESRMRGTKRTR